MDISTFLYFLALFYVFGLCNAAFFVLFKSSKIAKVYIFSAFILWNFLMSFWVFEIFPGSENYFASKRIEKLTGQKVAIKNIYLYDEFAGFQGDGYTLYYYDFEKLKNIDTLSLSKFPIETDKEWKNKKWKKSPMTPDDLIFLEQYLETNTYGNKDSLKLHLIYSYIKKASVKTGSFYSFSERKNRGIEIGFFSNKDQKFLYLNSMW